MLKIFKGFDPRLAEELKRQRKSIVKGLLCVAVGALLTAVTIPLTERAIRAIGHAAPVSVEVGGISGASVEVSQAQVSETEREAAKRQDEAIYELGLICLIVVGVFGLKYFFTRGQTF